MYLVISYNRKCKGACLVYRTFNSDILAAISVFLTWRIDESE
jgi:hypothetical protein